MGKIEYIPIQLRYLEALRIVKPEQVGNAVVAALRYAKEGEVPDASDSDGALLFWMLKGDIDRVQESLDETSDRQRTNINKRWHPDDAEESTDPEDDTEDTTVYNGIPRNTAVAINKKNQKKQNKKSNSNSGPRGRGGAPAEKTEVPTVEEVRAECAAQGYQTVDPEYFVHYYNGLNWMISGTPIHDWRSILWTWDARDKRSGGKAQTGPPSDQRDSDRPASSFDTDEFFDAAVRASYAKYGYSIDETDAEEES